MKLERPSDTEMKRYWSASTRDGFMCLLRLFDTTNDYWMSQDHCDYAKACLISNAVELKATDLLPDGWLEEWASSSPLGADWLLETSWMRRERWANLYRLTV